MSRTRIPLVGPLGARRVLAMAAALALAAVGTATAIAMSAAAPAAAHPAASAPPAVRYTPHPACPAPAPGHAACLAIIDGHIPASLVTSPAARRAAAALARPGPRATGGQPDPYTVPAPYMAADLQAAYRLPSSLLGSGHSVAIVDAYDDPNAASDLAAYRSANNLPACTTASGCLRVVNQDGKPSPLPPPPPPDQQGWTVEVPLDLDMASAVCPNCKITLVEATSSLISDLTQAEDAAAGTRLGADVISNSYGTGTEYSTEAADCHHYSHPGIAITASSGDGGFGVNWPAVCPDVTAVGGTTLYPSATARGWSETAWARSGSGCSAYIPKPAWQHDRLCGMRTTADVAAVADPNTPVAVYGSALGGWVAVAGTSVAAPIIAGVYALAGNAATAGPGASYAYAHRQDLLDVTTGGPFITQGEQSNGYCAGGYLCTAIKGYDGPTGLGTPDSIGAF